MPNFTVPNIDKILQITGKFITQMGEKVSEFAKTLEEKRKATESEAYAKAAADKKTECDANKAGTCAKATSAQMAEKMVDQDKCDTEAGWTDKQAEHKAASDFAETITDKDKAQQHHGNQ